MVNDAERIWGEGVETIYFAGGCFWGVEYLLEQQPGVLSVEAGYTGGRTDQGKSAEHIPHIVKR